MQSVGPKRHDDRIIIHFDYDCFYAAVFEKEDPKLKHLPFAVQQKQIIVTCNYEARRRGLYKLQLVREAKKQCPDVIIALGEDLTRFRNASRANYDFLRTTARTSRVDRLGFDEVFIDVTELVEYNLGLVRSHALSESFFRLDREDSIQGFVFDASVPAGFTHPSVLQKGQSIATSALDDDDRLNLRLILGSHLAYFLRKKLEEAEGYTSTVGISTNKVLAKLIGNVHKPDGQTVLWPPYNLNLDGQSNVQDFMDDHDIGQVPGIGFKSAQKIRAHLLQRHAAFDAGLVYGKSRETVTVRDVRQSTRMGPVLLREILEAAGMPKDMPHKVWALLHGVDNSMVGLAKGFPQQISMEDSYLQLDSMTQIVQELTTLSMSLLSRMRVDLTVLDSSVVGHVHNKAYTTDLDGTATGQIPRWLVYPRTLRLSTRPRPPVGPDGTRPRSFARISKSGPLPQFVFNVDSDIALLAKRLVDESLLPLFRQLHPDTSGWDLSLVNVCVTNMAYAAGTGKEASGQDIAQMFRSTGRGARTGGVMPSQDPAEASSTDDGDSEWDSGGETTIAGGTCEICGARIPDFAAGAHMRFHNLIDQD